MFGAEAAAQHYYRKPASKLGAYEAARLAVMLPRPKYFEKLPNSGYVSDRASVIVGTHGRRRVALNLVSSGCGTGHAARQRVIGSFPGVKVRCADSPAVLRASGNHAKLAFGSNTRDSDPLSLALLGFTQGSLPPITRRRTARPALPVNEEASRLSFFRQPGSGVQPENWQRGPCETGKANFQAGTPRSPANANVNAT